MWDVFVSKYFGFPLLMSLHRCSIFIHSFITYTVYMILAIDSAINPYLTSVKLFFVATVRSSPRDGPLNRWACLTTRLFKSLGVFNDALDNTRL